MSRKARKRAKGAVTHAPKPIGEVMTHQDLAKVIPKMGKLLEKSPHFAAMALTDPIKALEFVGYRISPEVKHHIRVSVPSLFGSRKAFNRAMHSTRGLPWVKSVRFVPKPKSGSARGSSRHGRRATR